MRLGRERCPRAVAGNRHWPQRGCSDSQLSHPFLFTRPLCPQQSPLGPSPGASNSFVLNSEGTSVPLTHTAMASQALCGNVWMPRKEGGVAFPGRRGLQPGPGRSAPRLSLTFPLQPTSIECRLLPSLLCHCSSGPLSDPTGMVLIALYILGVARTTRCYVLPGSHIRCP